MMISSQAYLDEFHFAPLTALSAKNGSTQKIQKLSKKQMNKEKASRFITNSRGLRRSEFYIKERNHLRKAQDLQTLTRIMA
jgi:hypothetical protein